MWPHPWHRHDLLRVRPESWRGLLHSQRPDLTTLAGLAEWADRGWPVIVRRRLPLDGPPPAGNVGGAAPPTSVPVAVPLALDQGKLRVALRLPLDALAGRVAPVTLRAARGAAGPGWQETIDAVLAAGERVGVEPRVFGSLLWEQLTGQRYFGPGSDLDLLWPVADFAQATELVRRLAAVEAAASPGRLDGELLLPDGGGVQWQEFRRAPVTVLIKTLDRVECRPPATLFPPADAARR